MTCQSPNADSGRVSAGSSLTKSSNMYLCDAGSNPPDADDLEVCVLFICCAVVLFCFMRCTAFKYVTPIDSEFPGCDDQSIIRGTTKAN